MTRIPTRLENLKKSWQFFPLTGEEAQLKFQHSQASQHLSENVNTGGGTRPRAQYVLRFPLLAAIGAACSSQERHADTSRHLIVTSEANLEVRGLSEEVGAGTGSGPYREAPPLSGSRAWVL